MTFAPGTREHTPVAMCSCMTALVFRACTRTRTRPHAHAHARAHTHAHTQVAAERNKQQTKAATKIQRIWRGHDDRVLFAAARSQLESFSRARSTAATCLQRAARRWCAREFGRMFRVRWFACCKVPSVTCQCPIGRDVYCGEKCIRGSNVVPALVCLPPWPPACARVPRVRAGLKYQCTCLLACAQAPRVFRGHFAPRPRTPATPQ